MSKLEFKLGRFSNIVVFQVVDQDDSITSSGEPLEYYANNGIAICSYNKVKLTAEEVSIGGFDQKNGADVIIFDCLLEAQTYLEKVFSALEEWARSGYFDNKITVEYNDDRGTYLV